jgi:hypothetical protein
VIFAQFRNAENGEEDAGKSGTNMTFQVGINPAEEELTLAEGVWVVTG